MSSSDRPIKIKGLGISEKKLVRVVSKLSKRPLRRDRVAWLSALRRLGLTEEMHNATTFLNYLKKAKRISAQTYSKAMVDYVLEFALRRRDFAAVRAALRLDGYSIPSKEPNDLCLPPQWNVEVSDESDNVEIQITPEEYEIWKSQPEIPEPEPIVEESATQKVFAEAIANNIPLHLERLIRRRDVATLRTMLRLYGHNISSVDPLFPGDQEGANVPEPSNNS